MELLETGSHLGDHGSGVSKEVSMRMTAIFLLVAVLAAAAPSFAAPAEVSDTARAVLEEAMERMGGEAALAKVESLRMKSRGTYEMGGMPMPYTSVSTFRSPDRFLWQMNAGMFVASMGLHGETAWSHWQGPPARVAGPMKDNMEQWLHTHHLTLVRPLLHLEGLRVTGDADGVKVEFPTGQTYVLRFEDGFLAGFAGDITHWDGRKGTQKVVLSEPKAFGDITMPSKSVVRTFVGDEPLEKMEEEAVEIEWNPEIDDEVFVMPRVELELLQASIKKAPAVQGVMVVHEGAYDGMPDTISRAMAVCVEAGLPMAGSVNAVFLNAPDEVEDPADLRTEVYMPVMVTGTPPELPEGYSMKSLPAAESAAMMARGPYGKADVEALGALMAWIGTSDYEVTGPPRIVYYHSPQMTVPEDMVSEVFIPVRKRQ
jgi:effector-binding domain-containing protein